MGGPRHLIPGVSQHVPGAPEGYAPWSNASPDSRHELRTRWSSCDGLLNRPMIVMSVVYL
jgi:hypothetical protein